MVKTSTHKKVVIQGLNDYIVIENEDVILIFPKQQEQDIKQITIDVKNSFGPDYT
jgi:mannose-1-phosphate guanylyltransferase